MKLIIEESKNLIGSFHVPPAKSHGWRALFLSGFAYGKSIIKHAKESKDWTYGIDGMQKMGAKFNKISKDEWEVEGVGDKYILPDDILYCGNSGPLLRYYIGICAAIFDNYVVVTGDDSIRHLRPSGPIIDAVNQLGAWAVSTKGDNHAPVIIKGGMNKNKCIVEGSDSQTISGLLIGCALRKTNTEIIVKNAGEKGWVGMTIYWLNKAGIQIENIGNNYDHYIVHGGNQIKSLGQMTVPNDWQAAPSPIIAGILIPGSKIEILDMDPKDVCPDRLVVDALKKMGANILYKKNSVVAQYSPDLKGIRIDPNWYTDQFMPIAIAAAFAKGNTEIYNDEIQRHKECDRIKAVAEGLRAMGVDVFEKKDGMIIKGSGGKNLKGAIINCYKDHRMIMNFTVAGMRASGKTVLTDAEYLEKTFQDYENQLKKLGASISISKE